MRRLNAACASGRSTRHATPKCCCAGARRRPPEAAPGGVDLGSLSEAQLERLYAGLVRLARLDKTALAALVEHVLSGDELGSS
jgi:hypothetical protein